MARTKAQRVVIELIRAAGGTWDGRAKLFKAFYFAHLYYASQEPGILTDWPMVRLPQGPGIQHHPAFVQNLVTQGYLKLEKIHEGPYPESRFHLTELAKAEPPLPEDAVAAIRKAADFVLPKTAAELSQIIQERSRSWRSAKDGAILDIYIDLIAEEEFEEAQTQLADLDQHLAAALLNRPMDISMEHVP